MQVFRVPRPVFLTALLTPDNNNLQPRGYRRRVRQLLRLPRPASRVPRPRNHMSEQKHPQYSIGLEKEAHLTDYINVVLRRWKIVLLVFLLVFIGVTVKTFLTEPVYEAYTTLEVRKAQQGNMLKELGMDGSDNSLSTEIEVLRSRSLAEQVAKRMNLEWQVAETTPGLDCRHRRVCRHRLRSPGWSSRCSMARTTRSPTSPADLLGKGRSGEVLRAERPYAAAHHHQGGRRPAHGLRAPADGRDHRAISSTA